VFPLCPIFYYMLGTAIALCCPAVCFSVLSCEQTLLVIPVVFSLSLFVFGPVFRYDRNSDVILT